MCALQNWDHYCKQLTSLERHGMVGRTWEHNFARHLVVTEESMHRLGAQPHVVRQAPGCACPSHAGNVKLCGQAQNQCINSSSLGSITLRGRKPSTDTPGRAQGAPHSHIAASILV